MVSSRRDVLIGMSGLALAAVAPRAIAAPRPSVFYVGARGSGQSCFASAFDGDGRRISDLALPSRGHGFAVHPRTGQIVAFARRPGRFAILFDPATGRRVRTIEAADGRRFCGHGVFARQGAILIATELEYETGDGVLGVYDVTDGYRRVREYRSGGLDPHETLLLGDGDTLAVANGGILTDPDAPGVKLNRDSMDSSLAYIDTRDGRLIEQRRLPDEFSQLSLRHMSLSRQGLLAVVMQYEGPSGDLMPLVVTHRPGHGPLEILDAPDSGLGRLRNYCGSVAFDTSGRILAVTSPVGGVTAFWDMTELRFLGVVEQGDVCGLAAADHSGAFVVTSGIGGPHRVAPGKPQPQPLPGELAATAQWDNHLLRVTA